MTHFEAEHGIAHVYTVKFVRHIEGDEYENDRTDQELKEQLAREIQEVMIDPGLPAGFFNVTKVKTVNTTAEIDKILGTIRTPEYDPFSDDEEDGRDGPDEHDACPIHEEPYRLCGCPVEAPTDDNVPARIWWREGASAALAAVRTVGEDGGEYVTNLVMDAERELGLVDDEDEDARPDACPVCGEPSKEPGDDCGRDSCADVLVELEKQAGACVLTAENMHTADDCTMHDHE